MISQGSSVIYQQQCIQLQLMLSRILKCMYGASKSLPLPEGMSLQIDPYRSVHLTLNVPIQNQSFNQYMLKIIDIEETQNKKVSPDEETNAIWVHLKTDNLSHAGFLCQRGFKIHHGLDQDLSLYKWISRRSMLIPPFCPFVVACGAVVIHNNKILLVKQKNGMRKGQYGLPGGRADVGQLISSCAQRQLWQQVGLKAKFKSVFYFRELPINQNKHIDMYFVCLMEFSESALEQLKFCEREVAGFEWIDLEDYYAFAQKNSFGTQREIARYIDEVYRKGFDFKEGKTPYSGQYQYIFPGSQAKRYAIGHHLLQL